MDLDIVPRLRIVWTSCTDRINKEREEAADEIERLRKELKAWQDAHRAHPDEFGGNPE